MGTVGDDLETIDLGREPEGDATSAGIGWRSVVLVVCAIVVAAGIVVIAVMEWRQARYAREQACVQRAYTMSEFDSTFPEPDSSFTGEDARIPQIVRVAKCYGRSAGVARVPDVIGRQLPTARALLRQAGFVPTLSPGNSVRSDAVVTRQEPGSGSEAERGSTVELRTRR